LLPLGTEDCVAGTVVGTGVREACSAIGITNRFFAGQIDDTGIWDEALTAVDAALLNGLGRIGDNDLRWLPAAGTLWRSAVGSKAVINGRTWKKVSGLPGAIGDWVQAGGRNGAGSFIVLNQAGDGLQLFPQWWENTPVRFAGTALVLIAALGALAWSFDHMRVRVQLKRLETAQRAEAERRRISQDLHDDLGARLTEIVLLGEKVREGNVAAPNMTQHVGTMTDKAQALVKALDEVVWTVNPANDYLPDLVDYLSGYAQEFLQNTAMRCRLDVAKDLPKTAFPTKTRRNILNAVKEALNNAVRHSGGSEVWLRIQCEAGLLLIIIEDNGRGITDGASPAQGSGMRNMRERIASQGGSLTMSSKPGAGTIIQFRIPFPEAP
jgi:signal transduction histidine kinase